MEMEWIALVSVLIALGYFYLLILVGRARIRAGIIAPACTGDERFERAFRVQQNTLEQLVVFYPALWIFGYYVHEEIGAALGLLFLVGRAMYARGYAISPEKRGPGFAVGALALAVLLVCDLAMLIILVLENMGAPPEGPVLQ